MTSHMHILHINDTEGPAPDLWPRLATAVQSYRHSSIPLLLLHAGDIPLESADASVLASVLRILRFDGLALGNHDFGREIPTLVADPTLPFLCANMHLAQLPGLLASRLWRVPPWTLAIIGLTLPDLPRYVPAHLLPATIMRDSEEALAALLTQLRPMTDLILVLSHAGMMYDRLLAARFPEIDMIIGGHDHATLTEPLQEGTTMIVQAPPFGTSFGLLSLSRYQCHWALQPIAAYRPDARIASFWAQRPDDRSTIVGTTQVDLRSATDLCATPFNSLVVDLMRQYAQADIALLRCASVSNTCPPGIITTQRLTTMLRCGHDHVVRLRCTGADLLTTLEQGAREGYYLLTVAGATVSYDFRQAVGQRVVRFCIHGHPVDPNHHYVLACSEVLANGVGNFDRLPSYDATPLPLTLLELVTQYIQGQQTIRPVCDDRVTIYGFIPSEHDPIT